MMNSPREQRNGRRGAAQGLRKHVLETFPTWGDKGQLSVLEWRPGKKLPSDLMPVDRAKVEAKLHIRE